MTYPVTRNQFSEAIRLFAFHEEVLMGLYADTLISDPDAPAEETFTDVRNGVMSAALAKAVGPPIEGRADLMRDPEWMIWMPILLEVHDLVTH